MVSFKRGLFLDGSPVWICTENVNPNYDLLYDKSRPEEPDDLSSVRKTIWG
ncbi:hypothetical protein SAMN02927937_01529 [Paenimyroides aquimaris]|uniref:Uncharacterized protein n=1 Tax=Paenimyroides marinum TaxID=1159016 RepID=A0A1H6L2U9_9FLAO|nr:hypothetical protein SAMN02927937_01529 [Paenimyroides aquimaris]